MAKRNMREILERNGVLKPARKADLPDPKKIVRGSELTLRGKQITEREMQGKSHVVREIDLQGTAQILIFSDWHIGHASTDEDAIKKQVDYLLENDNVFCIFTGDPLEGINPEYVGSVMMQTPLMMSEQVGYFRTKYLEKLVAAGKVLAMVTDYDGHTGWPAKQSALRLYHYITAGYDLPLLRNGGQLDIVFPDGKKKWILNTQDFHTPPKGSTEQNPTGGLHQAAKRQKSRKPKVLAAGHIHKGAVSVEINTSGDETIAIAAGTTKGTNPDLPADNFMLGNNPMNRYHESGAAYTITNRGGKKYVYPTYGLTEAGIINHASQLLDYTESQGITQELLQETDEANGYHRPKFVFDSRRSILEDDDSNLEEQGELTDEQIEKFGHQPKPADQYRVLTYKIETPDPIMLAFFSHTLHGSSSSELPRFRKMREAILSSVLQNPHAALIVMRGLFERGTASSPNRKKIVTDAGRELQDIADEGRVLGVMVAGEDFRSPAWKKSIGKDFTKHGPFMPGTYLADTLNTHLFNHLSRFDFRVGPNGQKTPLNYRVVAADKLGRSGSSIQTFNGLRRIEMQSDEEADIYVGGHTPTAGFLAHIDPYSAIGKISNIALGWLSKNDQDGAGNRKDASPGGQAAILMPPLPGFKGNQKMVFPEANIETANEHHLMLLLYARLLRIREGEGGSLIDSVLSDVNLR